MSCRQRRKGKSSSSFCEIHEPATGRDALLAHRLTAPSPQAEPGELNLASPVSIYSTSRPHKCLLDRHLRTLVFAKTLPHAKRLSHILN